MLFQRDVAFPPPLDQEKGKDKIEIKDEQTQLQFLSPNIPLPLQGVGDVGASAQADEKASGGLRC